MVVFGQNAFAISAGTTSTDAARKATVSTTTGLRGNKNNANAYLQAQRNNYYLYTQTDVDTACHEKIYACLAEYCGDITIVPGQRSSRCTYSSESDLYNYALLCLQKDTSVLLPQYATGTKNGTAGMNTAARLCPSYVSQELMSYLSMANLATQLTKSHSDLCLKRRQELEAATACYSVAISYGNETTSQLVNHLTDTCGAGVEGGSVEMVTKFANAGNVGANIWGWAEKIVTLDLNNKGTDWQIAVNAVLATYTNQMNLACGDNQVTNTANVVSTSTSVAPTLQAIATTAVATKFPQVQTLPTGITDSSLYFQVQSLQDIWNYSDASQVVMAGLTNTSITQNAFLSSAQMDNMQTAYKNGTKVFIIRDTARCYIVPVQTLTTSETSALAQGFSNCVSK